jgi:radical SAM protein with 4Fe4S-binding SPASM domain
MSLDEVKLMIQDLDETTKRWGFSPRFQISGGEPLARKDLMQIIDYTHSLSMETRLLTNGTLITEDVAKELKARGINRLQISLDGSRETHNRIRRRVYAYDKALEGVANCKKAEMLVNVSMTLMRSNKQDMEDVVINAAKAGAGIVGFQSYVPSKDLGSKDPEFVGAEETYKLYQEIRALRKKHESSIKVLETEVLWQIMQWDTKLKQEARRTGKFLSGCGAGFSGFSVLSDGTVYPCRRLPISIANIKDGIAEIMLNSEVLKNLRDFEKFRKNGCCNDVFYCRGCRAVAYAITGDYMAPDPMCFKSLVNPGEIEARVIRR